jgi:hypothetical protein
MEYKQIGRVAASIYLVLCVFYTSIYPIIDYIAPKKLFTSTPPSINSRPSLRLDERTFISKAFADSMQPGQMIPFYYRASGTFDKEDITITTHITPNRFEVFDDLVRRYQGLVSFPHTAL